MPNTILGGRAKVLTMAEWGEVIHKPSYSIQHARAGIEEDETIALGVQGPSIFAFLYHFYSKFFSMMGNRCVALGSKF